MFTAMETVLSDQAESLKVDSARFYRNEGPCSEAIKKSGLPRSQIFFTTKVPPPSVSYDGAKASIESTFKQTSLDYIDLYAFKSLPPTVHPT